MMAVEIMIDRTELSAGIPTLLFEGKYNLSQPIRSYDVTSDGKHFVMIGRDKARDLAMEKEHYGKKVKVVLNWFEELERLVATD